MRSTTTWLGLFAILALAAAAGAVRAADADPAMQKICTRLLTAIEKKDRASFVEGAIDVVRDGMTDAVMEATNKQVGGRLKAGYTATYLCSLKQLQHDIYLWKLSFKDDGDDLVVRLVMKDGKIAGFFFQ